MEANCIISDGRGPMIQSSNRVGLVLGLFVCSLALMCLLPTPLYTLDDNDSKTHQLEAENSTTISFKSEQAITPYGGLFDNIAYSRVNGIGDAHANSAEHFLNCCSEDYLFDTLKGDLRVTSDNKVVMCHDKGFTLNGEGRITKFDSSKDSPLQIGALRGNR